MKGDEVKRIRVNVRVDKRVKEAFDEEIIETFGTLRPYAGIELEREIRSFLDRGDIADLETAVEELTTVFDLPDREKKIRRAQRNETMSVGYRISDDLRSELQIASEDGYRSFGRLVESIMYNYVTEGRIIQRLTEELKLFLESAQKTQSDSKGTKSRRTQTIVATLDLHDRDTFDMADFEEALEAVSGIDAGTYARKEYLPRVLNKLNFTWDPKNPGRFIDRESYDVPDIRDLTAKPYFLMNREDKRIAIKIAAYRSATGQFSPFSIADATTVLQGRPKRSTVKALMQEIASSSPGYEFSTTHNRLKVDSKVVVDSPEQNIDVIAIEHSAENWIDSAVDSLLQLRKHVDHELRDFPDPVIDKKIAQAKYPELLTGDNRGDRAPPEYLTQSDREKVLERLADEMGKPSVDIYMKEIEYTHV